MANPKRVQRKPLPRNQWGSGWNWWFWNTQKRSKAKRAS